MNEYIKSDLYRCYGKTGFRTFIRGMLEDPGFNYMFWLRMCQAGGRERCSHYLFISGSEHLEK